MLTGNSFFIPSCFKGTLINTGCFLFFLNWSQQTSELHMASMQSYRFYVVTLHDTELRLIILRLYFLNIGK